MIRALCIIFLLLFLYGLFTSHLGGALIALFAAWAVVKGGNSIPE